MADNGRASVGAHDEAARSPDSPIWSTDSGSLVNIVDSHLDTHLDKTPKAEITPEHVAALSTTVEAPALSKGDPERAEDPDLEDLGWSKDPKIPVPVLHGMNNEELWILVRRFNKVTSRFSPSYKNINQDLFKRSPSIMSNLSPHLPENLISTLPPKRSSSPTS
jgi:hypothetical protein